MADRARFRRREIGDSAEEIDRLVQAVHEVEGVGQVRSLLHLPGEEPRMKEQAPSAARPGG